MNSFVHPDDVFGRVKGRPDAIGCGGIHRFLATGRAEDVNHAANVSRSVVANNCVPQVIGYDPMLELTEAYKEGRWDAVETKLVEEGFTRIGARIVMKRLDIMVFEIKGVLHCISRPRK